MTLTSPFPRSTSVHHVDMYSLYLTCNTPVGKDYIFLFSPSFPDEITLTFSYLYFFLQTLSQLTNPGRRTTRAERRSFPRWLAAWFLSPHCP